ncbi:MAG: hypothetical protein IE909_19050 [Campylobacterales bacterium]|nr:hypothetical protein [Campylobacterales bacterium]
MNELTQAELDALNMKIINEINSRPRTLEELKYQKIYELEREKDKEQSKPVIVRGFSFFGGRKNGEKYKETFDLVKMMGKTSGMFAHTEGLVEVDEDFAKEVIIAIGVASYNAWYKFQQLKIAVDNTNTAEELEAIKWEN